MRAVAVSFVLLVSLAIVPPTSADDHVVGSGNITAGVALGHQTVWWFIGGPPTQVPMPYELRVEIAGLAGETVETEVQDNSGAGYYVDMAFYAGTSLIESDCQTTEDSQALLDEPYGRLEIRTRCVVPDGADLLVAFANLGADLDVTVVRH